MMRQISLQSALVSYIVLVLAPTFIGAQTSDPFPYDVGSVITDLVHPPKLAQDDGRMQDMSWYVVCAHGVSAFWPPASNAHSSRWA